GEAPAAHEGFSDRYVCDAGGNRAERCVEFRQHAALDDAIEYEGVCVGGVEVVDHVAAGVHQTLDVGDELQGLRAEACGECGGGAVGVDVEQLAVVRGCDRRDDGEHPVDQHRLHEHRIRRD